MKAHNKHTTIYATIALAFTLLLATGAASSTPGEATEQAVRHLLGYVSGSGMTFVRNASEHSSTEAAEHMLKKYRHFRDDIETPDDFIKLCATKSLLSGKPYRVIDREGNVQHTSDWLRAELAAWLVRNP